MKIICPFFLTAFLILAGSCKLFHKDNTESQEEGKTSRHTSITAATKVDTQAIEIPAISSGDMLIAHTGYALCYDISYHNPKWVAWSLTREKLTKRVPRHNDFRGDENIPARDRIEKYDYNNPVYDRGHMCPSGDMRYDRQAQSDCFYMTNICPQIKELNQTWWEHVESATRRWAQREGTVYICCGPIFYDDTPERSLGRNIKIRIPDAFFKVILSLRQGKEKAIGFYYTNTNDRQTMDFAKRTVDEIERITGLDFFCNLPDDMEERIESQCNLRIWN